MSRTVRLVAAALATVAVAVAAPPANAGTGDARIVDPLAVSYLQRFGLSPSEVQSWTVGACSHRVKAPSCYAVLEKGNPSQPTTGRQAVKVDPLAVSYLQRVGLSPSEVQSWTVGACSHAVRAPSCYAMFDRAIGAAEASSSSATANAASAGGFDWADASIGAGATLGLVLLVGGLGATLANRHGRRRPIAGM